MDQALLTFHNRFPEGVDVFYTSDYCYKCLPQPLASVERDMFNVSSVISTKFTLSLRVDSRNVSLCSWSQTYEEGGQYSVWIQQQTASNTSAICRHSVDENPRNAYLPLLVALLVLAVIALLFVLIPYINRKYNATKRIKNACCPSPQYTVDCEVTPTCEAGDADAKPKQTRLRSLDTFRGFSLTVMVFVNYGGGGYWFMEHAPWNGLTVADLVMPWFVFIIGTSVVLAFRSMRRKGVSRVQLLRKLTWRTAVLLLLGFCFLNYSPKDGPLSWSWLRIPGVLQRLGFTYFVLSLMQTAWGQTSAPARAGWCWGRVQDLLPYWPEWLFILLLETLWLCLTFLLPVPGCPAGYLGAGGIGDHGLYPDCTGGAAGYIDRWVFGDNMFRWPTCRELYRTTMPFDPEGILGTINSVVMGFMGMQAGKIFLCYRGDSVQILSRFLGWAVVLGASTAVLSKCTRDEGFIPVNKNLWSLSYVTCMGSLSFLLLGAMYVVVGPEGLVGRPAVHLPRDELHPGVRGPLPAGFLLPVQLGAAAPGQPLGAPLPGAVGHLSLGAGRLPAPPQEVLPQDIGARRRSRTLFSIRLTSRFKLTFSELSVC
ncbi:unnamed protein product [Gadus morhua 'NCC']